MYTYENMEKHACIICVGGTIHVTLALRMRMHNESMGEKKRHTTLILIRIWSYLGFIDHLDVTMCLGIGFLFGGA